MQILRKLGSTAFAIIAIGFGGSANASNDPAMDAQVSHIDNEWARIKYQVKDSDAKVRQMDALAKQAAAIVARYPGRAEPLLWQGIATSEEAAMANVFHQLGLATTARDILQKAAKIDPKAAKGGVVMSLGVLYYKVPGWPVGFGNREKAQQYLQNALVLDPEGLDANYFYGDFLIAQGEYAKAKLYLARALKAPVNPHRPVWDSGRRADVRELIAKADKHLG